MVFVYLEDGRWQILMFFSQYFEYIFLKVQFPNDTSHGSIEISLSHCNKG